MGRPLSWVRGPSPSDRAAGPMAGFFTHALAVG